MKRKVYLKKRKPFKKKNIFIITLVLCCVSVVFFLNFINSRFTPILLEMAELEIQKFSTAVVQKAIAKVVEDEIDMNELFDTVTSNSGEIQTIDFNPVIVNKVLNTATSVVQYNLKLLEDGDLNTVGIHDMNLSESRLDDLKKGIITKIPMGVVTKNSLLSNIGPSIPIRLHYIGDVNSNITTEIVPYGINNALVRIGVKLEMTAQIILPFTTDKIVLECSIPLSIKMIQGNIPNYYGGGLVKDSSLYSIPLE